jgi:hypothetical protein
MAGLVPAISLRRAQCLSERDARVKPAYDNRKALVLTQDHHLNVSLNPTTTITSPITCGMLGTMPSAR